MMNKKVDDRSNVKVFCRLRPPQSDEANCVSVVSGTTLSFSSSEASQSGKEMQCTFHRVFDEQATQEAVFDQVALPLVSDLFDGKNGLLIMCGNAGSGKTYTMTGNAEKNGILPHVLDVMFTSIAQFQSAKFLFKPDKMNGFDVQSEGAALKDRQHELDKFLMTARTPEPKMRKGVLGLGAMNHGNISLHCPPIEGVDEDRMYAVFISFIVLYGNGVYDLFDFQDNSRLRHPQAKIVREGSCRNMYVHGVVEEEVKASSEAFQIYLGGLQKKKVVASLLNTSSQRFHSVFTIRLVQAPVDGQGSTVADKSSICVSQLCLVDLARPERSCHKNFNQKLIESGHINNSLTTLRSCLEIKRENQFLRHKKLMPFRDSKLTYLFKNYFEEEHRIHLVVCLNPVFGDLDEIIMMTKFADVKEMLPGTSRKVKKQNLQAASVDAKRRKVNQEECRRALESAAGDVVSASFPKLEIELHTDVEVVPSLVSFLEKRQAQCDSLRQMFKPKANAFRVHLEESGKQNALISHEHFTLVHTLNVEGKKALSLEEQTKNSESKVAELESKLMDSTSEFDALQQELETVTQKRREVALETVQLGGKLASKFTAQVNKMEQQTFEKLEAQKAKFMENEEMMSKTMQKMKNVVMDEAGLSTTTDSDTSVTNMDLTCESAAQMQVLPVSRSETIGEASKQAQTAWRAPTDASQEMWLEHRSGLVNAELGTVMKPHLQRSKKITRLPDAENVANLKASKYCLLMQEADTRGEVETVLYKADVVPTTSGGAQFIFNDVEKLKQCSPLASPARGLTPAESAAAMSADGKNTNAVA